MSENENMNTPGTESRVYTETVVEYVDNRRSRTMLGAVLVLLLLLLVGVSFMVVRIAGPLNAPKRADLPDGISWMRSIYSWGPSLEQKMNGPIDTAIGPDGTIWVVTNKQFVIGYGPDGQVRRVINRPSGMKEGNFYSLEGVATDEDGNVYVCDFGRNAVIVFDDQGKLLREIGIQLPMEVAVRNGRIAVAAGPGIALFTTQGDFITKWGGRGTAESEFDLPHGIALADDGTVFVSDTQNRRIKAYTQEGKLLWVKAAKVRTSLNSTSATETVGGVRQNMQIPAGMAIDGKGRLLVVDPFEFQVLVLDAKKQGQVIARYGEYGPEDGKFGYPTGISYDTSRDTFAVADTANNRVQIIRLPGTGGTTASRMIADASDKPLWLCSIPLLALLAAIITAVMRKRRSRTSDDQTTTSPTAPTPQVTAS